MSDPMSERDPSTSPLDEGCRWDAIVVGAGPAGAVAAHELARAGARTLLLDKARFPRSKACGCCLSGATLRTLEAIGLARPLVNLHPRPLHALRLWSRGRSAEIPLTRGVALSREALDSTLARNAVLAGATFADETLVESSEDCGSLRRVTARRGAQRSVLSARLVIAADGLSGRMLAREPGVRIWTASSARVGAFARLADDERRLEDGRIHMACGAGGYVGAVRIEDGCVNLAAALDGRLIRAARGLEHAALQVWTQAGLPALSGWQAARWSGTAPLTRAASPPGAARLLAVGDASGYVEPFTGEGMAWGVMAAVQLAPLALQAIDRWDDRIVDQWARTQSSLLARRRRYCRWVALGLRYEWVRRIGISLLRRWPGLAAPYVGTLDAPAAAAAR